MTYPQAVLSLIVGEPRVEFNLNPDYSRSREVLFHLQKYSRCGFMMTWPFCFHIWFFWKKQEGDDVHGWVPGTEQGIYMRTPGYRWDTEQGMKWTWGYVGGNWD